MSASKSMDVQITLKSGAQITVKLTKWTVERNGFGNMIRFKWNSDCADGDSLIDVDFDSIAAIVQVSPS